MQDKIIIVRIWEGLGNQLFQYAFARSLKEKGYDVRLDLNKSYDDLFTKYKNNDMRSNVIQNYKITLPFIDVEEYGKYSYLERKNWKDHIIYFLAKHGMWKYGFYEELEQHYQKKSAEICRNCYVKGWFQSEEYFLNIRDILLEEIVPKKEIHISKKIQKILNDEQSVSIHIRRGDYVKTHHDLNIGYFHKAISEIKKTYESPKFLVFSDDIEWVKLYLKTEEICVFVNKEDGLEDFEELYIMSLCKSNIISNSTFSWWGAWLNRNPDKVVISSRQWLHGQKDIVPSEWIII